VVSNIDTIGRMGLAAQYQWTSRAMGYIVERSVFGCAAAQGDPRLRSWSSIVMDHRNLQCQGWGWAKASPLWSPLKGHETAQLSEMFEPGPDSWPP